MPNRNGTGPNGMGPMTGRGLGRCRGNGGFGRRVFNNVQRNLTKEEEKEMLKKEKADIEKRLKDLN